MDDVDAALEAIKPAGFPIEYGPADEPQGVRRHYVRDPFGKLVNILAHAVSFSTPDGAVVDLQRCDDADA